MKKGYYSFPLPDGGKLEARITFRVLKEFAKKKGFEHLEELSANMGMLKSEDTLLLLLMGMEKHAEDTGTPSKYNEGNMWELVDELPGGLSCPVFGDMLFMIPSILFDRPLEEIKKAAEEAAARMGKDEPAQETTDEEKKSGRLGSRYIRRPQKQD